MTCAATGEAWWGGQVSGTAERAGGAWPASASVGVAETCISHLPHPEEPLGEAWRVLARAVIW